MLMVLPIAKIATTSFAAGMLCRVKSLFASIMRTTGRSAVIVAVTGIVSQRLTGCRGMVAAVAGIMAAHAADRSTMIQSIAVVMAVCAASSGAVIARFIGVVLSTDCNGMILAIAGIATASGALHMLFFLAINLAAPMPASQFLVIAVLFIAPKLAALDATRVAIGAGTNISIAATALIRVAVVLWISHAAGVAFLAEFTNQRVVAGRTIVRLATIGANIDRFAQRVGFAIFAHAAFIPNIRRAAFRYVDLQLRKAAGDDRKNASAL